MSKRPIHRMGLSVALAALFVAAIVAPVAAGSQTKVTGLLTPDTGQVCTEDAASVATYTVTGTLTGCWYIDEWTIRNETPSGAIQASGTELSRAGWAPVRALLDDLHVSPTRSSTARWSTADATTRSPPGRALAGSPACSGVLQMHDLPNGCSTYTGQLSF